MDIDAANTAIIEQISASTGVKAQAFPKDFDNYIPVEPLVVHLVQYQGATPSEAVPNRKNIVVQETKHDFLIVSVYRHLTGIGGLYVQLEALRNAMVGFTIPDVAGATYFTMTDQKLVTEKNGVWYYRSLFSMSCPEGEA